MKDEISAAVNFILKLTKQNSEIKEEKLKKFEKCLNNQLLKKFANHWHPQKPFLGQGYRCLRINGTNGIEPTIAKAALDSGVNYADLKLPLELTVWVDPEEVCCRFGEHKGSYCTIASFSEGNKEDFIDKIVISELISSEKETYSEDWLQSESTLKNRNSFQKSSVSSIKENISPEHKSINASPKVLSMNPHNILKNAMSPCNRSSGRILNGASPPFVYGQHPISCQESFQGNTNGLIYTQSESFPCHKQNSTSSWGVGSHSPVNSHHQIYNYSPPPSHFSSHENFNLSRTSPPTKFNKLRWNSGPILDVNGSHYLNERHGWYYPRQLARV